MTKRMIYLLKVGMITTAKKSIKASHLKEVYRRRSSTITLQPTATLYQFLRKKLRFFKMKIRAMRESEEDLRSLKRQKS